MVKELIRNGGFERGNLDFFETTGGTVDIVSDVKKRGNYAAKLTIGDEQYIYLVAKDFIEVIPYVSYKSTAWIKNVTCSATGAFLEFYDSDYVKIADSTYSLWLEEGACDWTFKEGWLTVPLEASYLRFYIRSAGNADTYCYVDSLFDGL